MRRRRRRNVFGVWITVLVIVFVLSIFGLFFWKISSIKNSPEFGEDVKSQYLFIDKDNNEGYYIVINGSMRTVNVIKLKNHVYNSELKKEINFSSPVLSLEVLKEMFSLDVVYSYYSVLDSVKIVKLSEKYGKRYENFGELLKYLTTRGLKLFDYFSFDGVLKMLRPETTLTSPSFAKLIDALGRFSVRIKDIPTITEKPLEIKVGNKTLERLYIDLEKLNQLKQELGG
ncbi:hypothetical protein SU69_01210 [Thermosipho melanesiensis]|uniref:Uncharacterized protein n=2 Tax=Thermosipho melanesiensis TaxID=46541 RepID=A6LJK0_THEM4|nr:hypothetical protein [Thermosipho melanesiensis]ABR30101.1 hypothetical protein Tmel_0227 [Thermosipho melanesiensis BI429]APT73298.1 hypothetical protein BW47_01250 [Thermosipho melanesiensis]OOC38689.1 hypothetical protein SU68_01210 [Thermosipho melanesiensis]OOC40493.1 hypothetical protein SU70_01210 [Thermosipho melanesiensis]OOC40758.1 hypothetical protein SU69_01210 [Thermosipho melanesiensis]